VPHVQGGDETAALSEATEGVPSPTLGSSNGGPRGREKLHGCSAS
jgi:hypothetical protein